MTIWINGIEVQALKSLDTDTIGIDSVRLGAMNVTTETRGNFYLDDFASTRFSRIGLLPDPGTNESMPTLYTLNSQPDSSTGLDAYIYASGSNTNYGTEQILLVGHNGTNKLRSLLKFDMSSIPENATITSATLILRMNSGSGTSAHTMSIYPVLKNWMETGVTWNKFDGTTSWQVAGASGTTDSESINIGMRSFVSGETAGFKSILLNTAAIQEYVNGTRTNNGWILRMDVETGFLKQFASSDSTTAANRPQLVVEYTLPEEEPDWVNKAYTYGDEDHIHAVTSLVVTDENNNQTTNTYRYDANGNMTCRIEGGETFLQAYNAENRMSGVLLVSGDCDTLGDTLKAWQFTYDGDGVKVKQEYTDSNGTLTTYYYAGGAFEIQTDGSTETVRQYYAIAGVTVGMREGSTFYYFLTDHLGSVVGVTDSTGTMVSETRYLPFGEVRTDVGIVIQTDYGYTFQRNDSYIKLLDYRFRSYSPELGRFVSPDSIVPNFNNPQSLNRYSYVNNRPINYNDPTGHCIFEPGEAIVCGIVVVGALLTLGTLAVVDQINQTQYSKQFAADLSDLTTNTLEEFQEKLDFIQITSLAVSSSLLNIVNQSSSNNSIPNSNSSSNSNGCEDPKLCLGNYPRPKYDSDSDNHVYPRHHDPDQYTLKSKFLEGEGGQNFADEVYNNASTIIDQNNGFVRMYANLNRVVGTLGETGGRIVMRIADGWILTQFPQMWDK